MIAIVVLLLLVLTTFGWVIYLRWEVIASWFQTLPSDRADMEMRDERRYEQVWIEQYVPASSAVLQVGGGTQTAFNIRHRLENPDRHVMLTNDVRVLHETKKVTSNVVHGAIAKDGQPVSLMYRNHAVNDYNGMPREDVETMQRHTWKQLEVLFDVQFSVLVMMSPTNDAELFLPHLANLKLVLIRWEGDIQTMEDMFRTHSFEKVEQYNKSYLWRKSERARVGVEENRDALK